MGHFFTKIILQGANQKSLVDYLEKKGRKTFVSPTLNNFTIVFDKKSEDESQELFSFASQLSSQFCCPVLAILVHDDRVLHYELYETGKIIDEYISNMGFHKPELENYPEGGDAQKLCTILGVENVIDQVRIILRTPGNSKGYYYASDRLIKLVKCLGIPPFWGSDCVGGYRYIERGDIISENNKDSSPEIALSQLVKTGEKKIQDVLLTRQSKLTHKKVDFQEISNKNYSSFINSLIDLIEDQNINKID